jgi:hypothetical protein
MNVEICRIGELLLERKLGIPSDPFILRVQLEPMRRKDGDIGSLV